MKLDIYRDVFDPDMLYIVQDEDIVWTIDLSTFPGDMFDLGSQLKKGEDLDELAMTFIERIEDALETKPIAMYQDEDVVLFVMADVLTDAEKTFLGWR